MPAIIARYARYLLQTVAASRATAALADLALLAYRERNNVKLIPFVAGAKSEKAPASVGAAFMPVYTNNAKGETSIYYDGVLNLGMCVGSCPGGGVGGAVRSLIWARRFPWFHGKLTVDDVEAILQGAPKGSYLVRVSSKHKKYVIVWVSDNEGSLVHILIEPLEGDPVNRYKVDSKTGPELVRRPAPPLSAGLTPSPRVSIATCRRSFCGASRRRGVALG